MAATSSAGKLVFSVVIVSGVIVAASVTVSIVYVGSMCKISAISNLAMLRLGFIYDEKINKYFTAK